MKFLLHPVHRKVYKVKPIKSHTVYMGIIGHFNFQEGYTFYFIPTEYDITNEDNVINLYSREIYFDPKTMKAMDMDREWEQPTIYHDENSKTMTLLKKLVTIQHKTLKSKIS